MESMLRWLLALVVVALIGAGGIYVFAGRQAPPAIAITQPAGPVGQQATLEVDIDAPSDGLMRAAITLEQNGRSTPLFTLDDPQAAAVTHPSPDKLRISRPIGKRTVPDLQSGTATIMVTAVRRSIFGLRELEASASKDVRVQLEPPRLSVLSTHHYVNHGGSEVVLYKVTPPDVASGVRVGDAEYRGFPASGAGLSADPSAHIAIFALRHDQDLETPITVFARDGAGNEARASFIDKVFPKPFRQSRIALDDRFLNRVVPEILDHASDLGAPSDRLQAFLAINGDLRRKNAERIKTVTANTSPSMLFTGPFMQLGNSKVEASFADHRTYVYQNKEVDRQVHLGFDLAATARVPVVAANSGTVLLAEWLGIYGNCIIVDHGLGVASLYGHLSSIDVAPGERVDRGQTLGRSGMTGLAGGDHLHFTLLIGGEPVNPVEWWDAHWMADRLERKLREAGGTSAPATRP
jgi:murein DD-endopeptidase MepM/ murein hydrolase activator NlpD